MGVTSALAAIHRKFLGPPTRIPRSTQTTPNHSSFQYRRHRHNLQCPSSLPAHQMLQQAAVPRRRKRAQLLLCLLLLPITLTVLLTTLCYERTVTASVSRIKVEPSSRQNCASTATAPPPQHHHPYLQQPLMQQQHTPPVLTTPQHAAVAASRSALQAYLDSPEFAAASAVAAAAATSSGNNSSWERGILVVAGGRKLLTHLVVQLKVGSGARLTWERHSRSGTDNGTKLKWATWCTACLHARSAAPRRPTNQGGRVRLKMSAMSCRCFERRCAAHCP